MNNEQKNDGEKLPQSSSGEIAGFVAQNNVIDGAIVLQPSTTKRSVFLMSRYKHLTTFLMNKMDYLFANIITPSPDTLIKMFKRKRDFARQH